MTLVVALGLVVSLAPRMALADPTVLDHTSTTWTGDSTIEAVELTIGGNVTVTNSITLTIPAGKKLTVEGSIEYRGHVQGAGWASPATVGLSKRAEAVDVQVLPQGQLPSGYDAGKAACVTR